MSPVAAPLPAEEFERLLLEVFKAAGLSIPAAIPPLARYLAELDRWRRTTNLTGDLSGPDLADHALESLVGSQLIPENAEVIDIGSGAGLPGVPLAIVRPDLSMTLLEPRRRRAAFLRHVARSVPVENVKVLEGRVEDLGAGEWTLATTRALGDLGRLLGGAAFLRPAGLLLSWTTDPDALSAALAPLFVLVQIEKLPRRGTIAILRKR